MLTLCALQMLVLLLLLQVLLLQVFIVLRAAVRAIVSLAVLLGFTCLVTFVYFVYFYEQINE